MENLSEDRFTRAQYIDKTLEQLFPETPIPLHHQDAYTLLVAVLLSAQCTDERVNKVTPLLFAKANNPQTMVKLSVAEIEAIIKPCGLAPRKARAIWELSKIILDKHAGHVPESFSELEALPGVGHKTASVVMAQAFGHPAFPVDTHIHRLAQQWELTTGKSVEKTEEDLKKVFAQNRWNKLHLRIIFFGRQFCQARQCDGLQCQICKTCFPSRKEPKEFNRA